MNNTSTLEACASLISEHHEMEGFLDQLDQLAPTADAENAPLTDLLQKISTHINVHFACEEEGLFPIVSKYHPMVLMELEHEELVSLRDQLLASWAAKDIETFRSTATRFSKELRDHMARENGGIFPTAEQSLDDYEKQDVIFKMDQVRARSQTQAVEAIRRPAKTAALLPAISTDAGTKKIDIALLAKTETWQAKQLKIKAGESLAEHWTPMALALQCVSGEAVFDTSSDSIPMSAGQTILVDPQLKHAVTAKTDCVFLLLLR